MEARTLRECDWDWKWKWELLRPNEKILEMDRLESL